MNKVMLLHGAFLLPIIALLATAAIFLTLITVEINKATRDVTLDRLYKEVLAYTIVAWGILAVVILMLTLGVTVFKLSPKVYATVMAIVGIIVAVALGGMSFIGNQKLELYLQMKIPEYYNAAVILMTAGALLVVYSLLVIQYGYGDSAIVSNEPELIEMTETTPQVKSVIDTVLSKYPTVSRRASKLTTL